MSRHDPKYWVCRLPERVKQQVEQLAQQESRSPTNMVLRILQEKLKAENIDVSASR